MFFTPAHAHVNCAFSPRFIHTSKMCTLYPLFFAIHVLPPPPQLLFFPHRLPQYRLPPADGRAVHNSTCTYNSNPPTIQFPTFCNLQLQFKLHLQHAHPRTCLASVGHSVRFGRGYSHRLCACQSSSDMLRVVRVLSSLMYVYRGAKPNKHSKHTIERDDKNVWMGA